MKTGVPCVWKKLALPIRRSLVPSVLTRGVVQRATLVALPSGSAAWAETAAGTEERAIVWKESGESSVQIAGAMPVVRQGVRFIVFTWMTTAAIVM